MSVLQMVLIALFIYLGASGSIVGNTIGWYCLGRPLVASFIVGLIMGDVQTAMLVGVPLQIAYLANVTPGGAVAWDLSYATYIGTATALALKGTVASTPCPDRSRLYRCRFGWRSRRHHVGIHYSLDVFLNRWAERLAEQGETRKMWMPNVLGGQAIGFLARFVPALAILAAINAAGSSSGLNIPGWFITGISTFGSMMAALGMGYHSELPGQEEYPLGYFLAGFVLVTYFGLNTMAVAIVGIIVAFIVYAADNRQEAF